MGTVSKIILVNDKRKLSCNFVAIYAREIPVGLVEYLNII